MDGFEATRRIRALAGPAGKVPIVAVTADVLEEKVQACLDAGINGYVAKPVERTALLSEIDRLVAQRATAPVMIAQ